MSLSSPREIASQGEFNFGPIPAISSISPPPDCVAIPLGNGGYAYVDEEDECRVDEYTWYKVYVPHVRTWYAKAYSVVQGKKVVLWMHRVIFGLAPEDPIQVDHKNFDGLDNRRPANIRLASRSQNCTNRRKFRGKSSPFRGVSKVKGDRPWKSCAMIKVDGARRTVCFGYFEKEEEAAYAFGVAAPLLRDPEFLPDDLLSLSLNVDIARQGEIKRLVIRKVKAALAGEKGNLKATSRYQGVSYLADDDSWRAQVVIKAGRIYLGFFGSETEAAYAYDFGVATLKLYSCKTNGITPDSVGPVDRVDAVRKEVLARIEVALTGRKTRQRTTSRFRGPHFAKNQSRWVSNISINCKHFYLGCYDSEIEAAVAYNFAVGYQQGDRLKLNPIPPEEMPSQEKIEAIRSRVAAKFAVK